MYIYIYIYMYIWVRLVYLAHKVERKGRARPEGHKIQFGGGKNRYAGGLSWSFEEEDGNRPRVGIWETLL